MRSLTREQIVRRYAEGFGCGEGVDYRSWLQVHSFSSRGVTTRMNGRVVRRQYVFFSSLEREVFLVAQRLPGVTDIREQVPLWPLEETEAIAKSIGVKHPAFAGNPVLMTTDLVLTRSCPEGARLEAISCKPSGELGGSRVLEKLEIERRYWAERGASWAVVTERDVPRGLATNLEWIDEHFELGTGTVTPEAVEPCIHLLREVARSSPELALSDMCLVADRRIGLLPGTCLTVFRHAVARGTWQVSLDVFIDPSKPLPKSTPGTIPAEPGPSPAVRHDRG